MERSTPDPAVGGTLARLGDLELRGSADVVILKDEPSEADEFDAKAHDHLAGAIASLIESETGGMVIGLEGGWGAGKSTVVRLLRMRLEASDSTDQAPIRVLVFDAWAHQGDPLRRTFLEALARDLEEAGWVSSTAASDFRAELSGRASTTHTKSTARLSLEGRIASATATLLPLGAVLLTNDFQSYHRKAQVAGLLLLVGPLLVVASFIIAKGFGIVSGGRQRPGRRRKLAQLPTFSFFAKEQAVDTTTSGLDRGDPTSVEFERTFSDILSAALTGTRRLVIVLDNLDRVEESDAKMIFATMRTFTSPTHDPAASWRPNVWTLIPYDPGGLDRLWNAKSVDEEGTANSRGEALTESTSAAFVEKLFQVRFETPPLVLSDWRGYLLRLLREARLGAHDDDVQRVLRLRALYRGVEPGGLVARDAPTPRQLKQLVNQIGGVRRQRTDIPLVHIAYYALLRRDRINVSARLVDGTLPHPKLNYLLGEAIAEDLAAIHFGTTQSLAQQLLLGGALENAVAASDSAVVERLKNRAGFIDALDSLDMASRAGDGGVELATTVAVLAGAGAFEVPGIARWLADAVLPVANATHAWSPAGREAGVGLALLLDELSSGDDNALQQLLARVETTFREADAEGHLHLEGLAALLDEVVRRGRASDSLRVRVTIPAERLVSSLAFFGTKTPDERSRAALELSIDPTEVASALVQAATSDSSAAVPTALEVLLGRRERVDLDTLASGCLGWLREQDPVAPRSWVCF